MTPMKELEKQLYAIVKAAIAKHWDELSANMIEIVAESANNIPLWLVRDICGDAVSTSLREVTEAHMATTFKPVVDQITKDEARKNLARRLKARGMSTELLDSID